MNQLLSQIKSFYRKLFKPLISNPFFGKTLSLHLQGLLWIGMWEEEYIKYFGIHCYFSLPNEIIKFRYRKNHGHPLSPSLEQLIAKFNYDEFEKILFKHFGAVELLKFSNFEGTIVNKKYIYENGIMSIFEYNEGIKLAANEKIMQVLKYRNSYPNFT